jgi:hypothetical protein
MGGRPRSVSDARGEPVGGVSDAAVRPTRAASLSQFVDGPLQAPGVSWTLTDFAARPGRLGELLLHEPVLAEAHRFALNEQRQARLGGTAAGLSVLAGQAPARLGLQGRVQGGHQARHLGERLLEPLTGAPQGRRLLGEDLLLDALDSVSAAAVQRRLRATRSLASW